MTTTQTDIPIATQITVVKHLLAGRGLEFVAHVTRLTLDQVRELAECHGHPDRAQLQSQLTLLDAQEDQIPTKLRPAAGGTVVVDEPRCTATTKPAVQQSLPAPNDTLSDLVARAGQSPKKSTRTLGTRLQALVGDLRARLDTEQRAAEAKERARAERAATAEKIAELQAEIAKLRGTTSRRARTGKSSKPTPPSKAARAWARRNGYEVADRGKLPADVAAAYAAAHPTRRAS